MKICARAGILAFRCSCFLGWRLSRPRGGTPQKLDPTLPYQAKKSNPVTYDVDFGAVVTPPYHAEVLKIWLPIPQTDSVQEVTEGELSSFPQMVTPQLAVEKVYGNKFAYFEFKKPQGTRWFDINSRSKLGN